MIQLEYEKGIPRNPLINAGALVLCDILVSRLKNPREEFIEFLRNISGDPNIDCSFKVFESEKQTGFRNTALINLMKSFGNIKNKIESVFYRNVLQTIISGIFISGIEWNSSRYEY